jgi:hypothetical protein
MIFKIRDPTLTKYLLKVQEQLSRIDKGREILNDCISKEENGKVNFLFKLKSLTLSSKNS